MDELEISGKRYISSKRAAKENRYHVDYIGQLIRAGKILGSKVGRTWYVESESLSAYLGQTYTQPTAPVPTLEHHVPLQTKVLEGEKKNEPQADVSASSVAAYKPSQDVRTGHPPVSLGRLRYIEDDEPYMPIVAPRPIEADERAIPIRTSSQPKIPATTQYSVRSVSRRAPMRPAAYGTHPVSVTKPLLYLVVILCALSFFGALTASYYVQSSTTVDGANTSSGIQLSNK